MSSLALVIDTASLPALTALPSWLLTTCILVLILALLATFTLVPSKHAIYSSIQVRHRLIIGTLDP